MAGEVTVGFVLSLCREDYESLRPNRQTHFAKPSALEPDSSPDYTSAMELADLLDKLHELPRADKFRAVQFLTADLAQGEAGTQLSNAEYAVWSPYDATDAAATLTQFLRDQPKSA